MDPKDIVLKAAEEYATLAIEHLTFSNHRRHKDAETVVSELEVHFLFPNLSDDDRSMLVVLDWLRRGVTLGVNLDVPGLNERERKGLEAGLRKAEPEFTKLRVKVERDILPRLTPLQKKLLTQRFLEVPFKQ